MLQLDLSANHLADERLIREVRALNARVRILALTARETRAAQRLLAQGQIDGTFAKGSAPEVLVRALREALALQPAPLRMSTTAPTPLLEEM